jgi:hypothetical protein
MSFWQTLNRRINFRKILNFSNATSWRTVPLMLLKNCAKICDRDWSQFFSGKKIISNSVEKRVFFKFRPFFKDSRRQYFKFLLSDELVLKTRFSNQTPSSGKKSDPPPFQRNSFSKLVTAFNRKSRLLYFFSVDNTPRFQFYKHLTLVTYGRSKTSCL